MKSPVLERHLTDAERKERYEKIFANGYTAKSLLEADFPEPDFIVPGLIPEGLTILAGSPKIGKSWLVLQIASALSIGGYVFGNIQVEKREVLYLALEDTPRRLATRLKTIKAEKTENLSIFTDWESKQEKAIQRIRFYKEHRHETSVIILDTLQSFRGLTDQTYQQDYVDLSAIRSLCDELQVSIIIVHHTRKMESIDPVHEISGTNGISGVADTILVLKKERRKREARLFLTSRDIEESETVLEFDGEIGSWSIVGDADIVRLSRERQEILELVEDQEFKPSDVAKQLGKNVNTTNQLCIRLEKEGRLKKVKYGVYQRV